jgi:predicted transcriptional regulator
MITDRDIIIRAVAEGKDPAKERVRDYMTEEVCACKDIETLQDAAEKMNNFNVSRLVVEDNAGDVVGIITFGSILRKNSDERETSSVVQHAVRKEAA